MKTTGSTSAVPRAHICLTNYDNNLKLTPHPQVKSPPIAVESTWLVLVLRIHLDGGIGQVKRIERDREMLVDLVIDRPCQAATTFNVLAGALGHGIFRWLARERKN